ncbi:NYN domain-containing protein [Gemmobacter fulvus]|uniref:NYN domain-containing protein n=1 Tax=Gemmobacter fulvus TaxID=2840474 RepID=A0A975S2F9_9RHOB|nr:NYN domain-containing protein [Gemmobacter fulvus]MBT9244786.1 NYN domain-containing protein [Gemmobacter fulvus]MDQ1848683.1 NYN domain-containing protein [Gemmobacter fulvus]QWK91627.1 NYN domain-containing protein [Gemmobacter fulvus]
MPEPRAPRLCVLIDADNVPAGYADAIFEEIASLGEASVRRIYGDWSAQRLGGWAKKVAALGLVADQQFSNTKGKNASDIGLVIAAMDFLHSGLFDGFVLVSSDSDFTRLAARIREQGLDVYGIGEKKTPEAFRMACKRFIYVENLGSDDTPEDVPQPDLRSSVSAQDPKPQTRGAKEPPQKAIPLIIAAMRAIDPEGEWYSLGQVGQYITQANPDFDTRTYGSAKLSDLVRKISRFEVKSGPGGQLLARDVA